jgi:hypothetical protein
VAPSPPCPLWTRTVWPGFNLNAGNVYRLTDVDQDLAVQGPRLVSDDAVVDGARQLGPVLGVGVDTEDVLAEV